MTALPRPDPQNPADAAFWDGVEAGELRIQRCTVCGTYRHPPRPVCAKCGSREHEPTKVAGTGRIWSFTVIHPPTLPAFMDRTPYAAVVVRLEEGVFMVSNLVDCAPDAVAVGMRVELAITAVEPDLKLPLFSPVAFVPRDFVVPTEVIFGDLRLIPLGPEHNGAHYAAWTSSMDHIRATPGFPDGSWPRPMSSARNLRDLERHADDFRRRQGFTYTVLDAGGDVIGCLYIYPSDDRGVDARVQSWVRAVDRDRDRPLSEAVRAWLRRDWPFEVIDYDERA